MAGPAAPDARGDFHDGLAWTGLGVAVLIGSVTMDRLKSQGINPYTVPGLLPGLLGIAMILLGGVLTLRSWRRGALHEAPAPAPADRGERRRRIAVVLALCGGYDGLLVGHGLPFWAASAIFVTTAIVVLQRLSRDPDERRMSLRGALKALAVGLGASVAIFFVFQELFLVRLP